ncbi:MAG: hypothetical protein RR293_05335 [Bacteroidales bacterium]
MKHLILYITTVCLSTFAATAQNGSEINREVTVEKEYSPQVDDAAKITGSPQVENPLVEKPLAEYSSWAVPMSGQPSAQPFTASGLGEQNTFEQQRGYAKFGMGNNLNIDGDAGIRLLNSKRDQLGVWYNHSSTGGRLKYLNPPEWVTDNSAYQRRNSNTLNLTYKHLFEKVEWRTSAAYRHNSFNYYGFSLLPLPQMDGSTDQSVNQYAISTGFRSVKATDVIFDASVGFEGYNNSIGYLIGTAGAIENHIETKLSLATKISDNGKHRLGFAIKMDNLFYKRTEGNNYTVITFAPFYKYANSKIRFKAGVKMDISVNDGTVFRFAPDIAFNLDFGKSFHLYTTIDGGKELNTWSKMSARNIYLNPTERLTNTYSPVNALLGIYCNYFPNFTVRVYGGIKSSVSALFDVRRYGVIENNMIASQQVIDYMPIDAYRWLGGFNINFKLNKFLKGEIKWMHNGWRSRGDDEIILSALPKNEWNIALDVFPIKNLSINADFYIGTNRGYRYDNINGVGNGKEKMSDMYDLSIGINYSLNKLINFHVQGNNLISHHYDVYYGMPAQRINFLMGIGVNF